MRRSGNRRQILAAIMATVMMLSGCGTAAQGQYAGVSAAPTANTQSPDDAALAIALAELFATPETALQPEPETALTTGAFNEEQRTELEQFCAAQPGSFSVYIQDITTGSVFVYNTETAYYPASLLKAAYALWLCGLDDASEIDLDGNVPNIFGAELADENLQQYRAAAAIPARTAMREMIAVSDNDSATMLSAAWPATESSGFAAFLAQLGYSAPAACSIDEYDGILGSMTVLDAAATMTALYNYFESDAENADFLRQCFLESEHDMLYVPVGTAAAKKYGSWDYAYHDAAIVYAPFPYIICCMTDRGDGNIDFPAEPTAAMQQLGQMVYRYLES